MRAEETMVVKFSDEEPGFVRTYYKVISINGESIGYSLYCCKQGEYASAAWYSCPGDAREPSSEIRATIEISDQDQNVLRKRGE